MSISVIILTYNEEQNIAQALRSVSDWAVRVFVFDSFSTDRTLEIARQFGATVVQHRFESYAKQRNAALECLDIDTEWTLFLDADEWLPEELRREIDALVVRGPVENGFYLPRRFIWMGRWIRRGYYPTWILRLFRTGKARCEDRAVNEHLVVEGSTGRLRSDFVHEDHRGTGDWIDKHNRYATLEAKELMMKRVGQAGAIDANLFGSQAQRKRWLRLHIWNRMPPLLRPCFYWFYRYVLCGGFLDGWQGFSYHFLQALWFPMLIDIKYLELKFGVRRVSSDRRIGPM